MNYKELLSQERIKMRLGVPGTLDQLIKDFQENERNLYNRKPKNKEELVIFMMLVGREKFIQKSNKMKAELENK